MAINISVLDNFSPLILLTQDYYETIGEPVSIPCRGLIVFIAYKTVYYSYHVGCCTTLFLFCFCLMSGVPAWRLM